MFTLFHRLQCATTRKQRIGRFKLAPVLFHFHKVSKEQYHIHGSALSEEIYATICLYLCMQKRIFKARPGKKALEFPYELDNPGPVWRRKQENARICERPSRDGRDHGGHLCIRFGWVCVSRRWECQVYGTKTHFRVKSMQAVTVQKKFTVTIQEVMERYKSRFLMCPKRSLITKQ